MSKYGVQKNVEMMVRIPSKRFIKIAILDFSKGFRVNNLLFPFCF